MPIRKRALLASEEDRRFLHMPTAPTSPTATKPRVKAASKRASTTRKPAAAKSAGTRARTQSKATHARGARTRALHESESAVKQAQTATRETAEVLGDYAERAVLIPVGAALIARDRVVDSVSETLATYSSPSKTQAQLRRFERRGATARNRLEREVRKARVRAERQLRQRRRRIESTVNELDERREAIAKSSNDLFVNRVPELANQIQERILSLV
jgi:hypothetical protein